MKKLFLLSLGVLSISLSSQQYSSYYSNSNVNANVNANINQNVSGNIYEHKTITTIDYGALQMANAQAEKNRLEAEKFADERQRQIALEIASDPTKAYDYGEWFTISSREKKKWTTEFLKKVKEGTGLKEFKIQYVIPYGIFNMLDAYNFQNVSKDGVTTDIKIFFPIHYKDKKIDIEKQFEETIVGSELELPDDQNKMRKVYNHKKDLNRATVFGMKGFRRTLIWEDKFENHITDSYQFVNESLGNGVVYTVRIRYNGDKDEVDFEKLEGRRYYLKPLIEKIISTARISDLELMK